MIANLGKYFQQEHAYYLNHINYRIIENNVEEAAPGCVDHISAEVQGSEQVRVILTRTLKFEPESLFELSVSYGVILKFNSENKDEINWHGIQLAEIFKENGGFALQNLMNRISLLIAEITASYGQSPIILPPMIAGNMKSDM